MLEVPQSLILRGGDYIINDKIRVRNPTISEIWDYGEDKYLQLVSSIVMRSYDACVLLDDLGKDFREVSDFEYFYTIGAMFTEDSAFLLPGINVREFECGINTATDDVVMYKGDIIIDRRIYQKIVFAVRDIHYIPDIKEIDPGSRYAAKVYVKQQRDKMKRAAKKKQVKSPVDHYSNIVSALVNSSGFKYNYDTVQTLHISQVLTSFYRINKIQDAQHLMSGIYSGTIDTSKLDKSLLSWADEIDINKKIIDESKYVDGATSAPSPAI